MSKKKSKSLNVVIPPPPDYLPEPARAIWIVKASFLHERGALLDCDLVDLAAYCRDIALYHRAMNNAASEGEIIDFEQGSQKIRILNNWLKVADQAFSRALKIADRFGFSLKSRASIEIPEPVKEKEPEKFSIMSLARENYFKN